MYDNVPESFEGNTIHQYSDRITFNLSNHYALSDVCFENCVRKMRFIYRKPERANFFTSVEELRSNAVHNANALHKQYQSTDLYIKANLNGIGDSAHRVSLFTGKMIKPEEGMRMLCVNMLLDGWLLRIYDLYSAVDSMDNARTLYTEIFQCIREIASSLRVDGKPIKIPRFDFSAIKDKLCQTMLLNEVEEAPGLWDSEDEYDDKDDVDDIV